MSTEQINRLHEQASERYLNGDYQGALDAWRDVLGLDAANEQALEGVHLASQFIDPGTQQTSEGTPEVERDLEQGLKVLDALRPTTMLHADIEDGAVDRKPGPPQGDGALAVEETLESWDPSAASYAGEESFGLEPRSLSSPSPNAPASAAAFELKRRVEDLLAQAKAKSESGERDEALSILSRLAILDEENADAAALRSKIDAEGASDLDKIELAIIEGVAALEADNLDEAERCLNNALQLAPEHREARHYLEKVIQRRSSGGEELLDAPQGESAPDEGAVERATAEEAVPREQAPVAQPSRPAAQALPAPPELPPARSGPRFTLPPRKVLILGAAGAAALVFAAIALPRLFGGGAPKAPAIKLASAKLSAPNATAPSPRPALPGKTSPAPDTGTITLPPSADSVERAKAVASALASARSRMASGDFGGAVVAFNEALVLDPGNAEAKAGILDAGDRYKESKAERDAQNNIKFAFRDGEFSAGLRLAYRLPPSVSKSYVDGVKVAGWYNLAIVALRAGECREALSHLDEALQVTPTDAEAKTLREFASRYVEAVKDRAFLDRVEALAFRSVPES